MGLEVQSWISVVRCLMWWFPRQGAHAWHPSTAPLAAPRQQSAVGWRLQKMLLLVQSFLHLAVQVNAPCLHVCAPKPVEFNGQTPTGFSGLWNKCSGLLCFGMASCFLGLQSFWISVQSVSISVCFHASEGGRRWNMSWIACLLCGSWCVCHRLDAAAGIKENRFMGNFMAVRIKEIKKVPRKSKNEIPAIF